MIKNIAVTILLVIVTTCVVNCGEDDVTNPAENAPEVSITSPDNNQSFVTGNVITFTGTATDVEDGVMPENSLVWTSDRDDVIGAGKSFEKSDLSQGGHVITLTAIDNDGNKGTHSINITVSATGTPAVTITRPGDGEFFGAGRIISFTGTATDPEDGPLSGTSLVWTSNKDGQIGTGSSLDIDNLTVNEHIIRLMATDSHGYTGVDIIHIAVIRNDVPIATITSPLGGGSYRDGTLVEFSGTGIDAEDGILPEDSLKWTSDKDGLIGTGPSIGTSTLSVDEHIITLSVTDSDSNIDTDEITVHITPDPDDYILATVEATAGYPMGFDGDFDDQKPVHSVSLDAFRIGVFEVTIALWNDVATRAASRNYSLAGVGTRVSGSIGGADDYKPIAEVSWRDCIAWCNAYSEQEGLTPVYYTTPAKTTVYRDPQHDGDIGADCVDWSADGYRLPTEAEWECAARYIDGVSYGSGNHHSGFNIEISVNECAWYYDNSYGMTHMVGERVPNSLNAYDMSGNVYEWCWDWYSTDYYQTSPLLNPRGPDSGISRVVRGGSFDVWALYCRTSFRGDEQSWLRHVQIGFRLCRSGSGK